jgi:hypothetical protein
MKALALCSKHRVRPHQRRWLGRQGLLLTTQGTGGLLRQADTGFGFVGALVL